MVSNDYYEIVVLVVDFILQVDGDYSCEKEYKFSVNYVIGEVLECDIIVNIMGGFMCIG